MFLELNLPHLSTKGEVAGSICAGLMSDDGLICSFDSPAAHKPCLCAQLYSFCSVASLLITLSLSLAFGGFCSLYSLEPAFFFLLPLTPQPIVFLLLLL
jgi:hypothetical protein